MGLISTTAVDFTIGQILPNNNNYNFKGVLDEIRIYNYTLSQEEISALYDLNTSIEQRDRPLEAKVNLLEQNYPNPFNGITTIRYHIRKSGPVQLIIFDILGRKIKILVDENQSSGTYSINWDGKNDQTTFTTSGIYFYELRTSDYLQRRKFLFIK